MPVEYNRSQPEIRFSGIHGATVLHNHPPPGKCDSKDLPKLHGCIAYQRAWLENNSYKNAPTMHNLVSSTIMEDLMACKQFQARQTYNQPAPSSAGQFAEALEPIQALLIELVSEVRKSNQHLADLKVALTQSLSQGRFGVKVKP